MSAHSSLDPESFQKLLASAFVAQESAMDAQSLSAFVELQRSIERGELDVDGAMHLIADRARNVANATGIAIALLNRDQLVYRAGSGSAATYVGRHVMAILSVSAHNEARGEILRVENTQTDARIEAAICRQFGAKSLLVLPIYHGRAVAGVLEVLFSEAHAFQDREVRTYRLMAGLVGEAISHAAQLEQKRALAAERSTMGQGMEQITPQIQNLNDSGSVSGAASNRALRQACGASLAEAGELPALRQATSLITQQAKRVPLYKRRWKTAVAVAAVLVLASWIAHKDRRSASPLGASAVQRSNANEQQVPLVPAKRRSANSTSKPQTALVLMGETRKAARAMPQWVRVGNNELDYVAQDVTVRDFTPKPPPRRVRVGENHVEYIRKDVTVRYFTPKHEAAPPIRSAARPVDR
jgi:hypothetical protein